MEVRIEGVHPVEALPSTQGPEEAPACRMVLEAATESPPRGFVDRGRIGWWSDVDGIHVRCDGGRARAVRAADGRWHGEAQLLPFPWAPRRLAEAVALAWVERQGGLVLHAVAVERDGAAELFLGPSGAGKSTAAGLVSGGRFLSLDRAVVLPRTGGGYATFGLSGGSPVSLPPSPRRILPVRALWRVRQGVGEPRARRLDPVEAVFVVRESVQRVDGASEDECVEAILRLCGEVATGELHTVLGKDLRALLDRGIQ